MIDCVEREAESIEERKRGSLSRNGNASEITQKVHKDGKDEWVWQKGSLAFIHTAMQPHCGLQGELVVCVPEIATKSQYK